MNTSSCSTPVSGTQHLVWRPIDEADKSPGKTIDIMSGEDGARYTDCFFEHGRWRTELFDGIIFRTLVVPDPKFFIEIPKAPEA